MEYPPDRVLKWILLAYLLWTSASVRAAGPATEDGLFGEGKRLVCYYANWAIYRPGLAKFTPENIDPFLCTHLIYAFAGMNKDYELKPFDSYNDLQLGNFKKFTNLKTYNPKLKMMIAVGGWNEGSKRFSKMVESSSSRLRFVRGAMSFLRKHSFDGLDLDWEYPGSRDGGREQDKEGYTKLVQELREAFDSEALSGGRSRLLLTMAVPAGKEYIDKGYDVPALARNLDFLNLLTYDYHVGQEATINHHAPLGEELGLEDWNPNKKLNVEWTVGYYLELGCPASKLVLGIPTYGRSFTLADPEETEIGAPADGPGEKGESTREAGYLAYYEICQMIQDQEWELEAPHADIMGPYAYRENQWVGFDDEDIIVEKVKFIYRKGLGGGMVWTLDNDDFRGKCYGERSPLISTLKASLQEGSALLKQKKAPTTAATPARSIAKTTKRTTTPKPPPVFTTPDPGPPFECKDEGFFNHPYDCKKYFWCLDSPQGLVPHAFTCPSGLHFNKARDSCDYANNVVCRVKKTTEPPATTPRPRPRPKKKTTETPTTTPRPRPRPKKKTTTTTEAAPKEELSNDVGGLVGGAMNGQSLTELLNLLQRLGVDQLHDKLQGRETAGTNSTVSPTLPQYRTPNRRTTAATESSTLVIDPFQQYAQPARGGESKKEQEERVARPPRGPQFHDPAPEPVFPDDSDVDDEDDSSAAPPGESGFPFVYHTPSRQRSRTTPPEEEEKEELDEEEEVDLDDVTTTSKPAHRRVVVMVRPIPGEANKRRRTRPSGDSAQRNNYVPAQTVGVRQEVRHRPNDVLKEEELTTLPAPPPSKPPNRRRPAVRRTTTITTSTSTTAAPRFRGPAPRRELIVLQSGKPAVPATTRRRHRPAATLEVAIRKDPGLALLPDGGVTCLRRGLHPHPKDCAKFVVCVPPSDSGLEDLDGFIHDCPQNTQFLENKGRCVPKGMGDEASCNSTQSTQ